MINKIDNPLILLKHIQLTVLFPKLCTRQFKNAVCPTMTVKFFDTDKSKYGRPSIDMLKLSLFPLLDFWLTAFVDDDDV